MRLFYRQAGSGPPVLLPNGMHLLRDFRPLAAARSLIFYDARNRGRSDPVADAARLARGIWHDVTDLDAVRRHFGIERLDAIGHSYSGWMLALYAREHPERVNRLVQIGPMQPNAASQYPPHLANVDATAASVFGQLARMAQTRPPAGPVSQEDCETLWSVLRPIFVINRADAGKIDWGRCELPNERDFMRYWLGILLPSIQSVRFSPADLARVHAPVLVVHGTLDRNSPYGAGREWAMLLPNAGLVTVPGAAHAPWVEAPDLVLGAIGAFLDGRWPEAAEKVTSIDPAGMGRLRELG